MEKTIPSFPLVANSRERLRSRSGRGEIPEQLLEAERCRARLGFLGISWDLMGIFGLVLQAPGGGGAGAWKSGAGSGGKQREVRMERDQRDGVDGKVDF